MFYLVPYIVIHTSVKARNAVKDINMRTGDFNNYRYTEAVNNCNIWMAPVINCNIWMATYATWMVNFLLWKLHLLWNMKNLLKVQLFIINQFYQLLCFLFVVSSKSICEWQCSLSCMFLSCYLKNDVCCMNIRISAITLDVAVLLWYILWIIIMSNRNSFWCLWQRSAAWKDAHALNTKKQVKNRVWKLHCLVGSANDGSTNDIWCFFKTRHW